MSTQAWIIVAVAGVVSGALLWFFAWVIVPFNLKRRHIANCAAEADDDSLEEIYGLVEDLGETAPNGFVLAKTNRTLSDRSCCISVPSELEGFPWAGKTFCFEVSDDISFRLVPGSEEGAGFLGRSYRILAVPRFRTKTGKLRNKFTPEQYVTLSDDLRRVLIRLCPRFPTELLAYLLCSGNDSFEFDDDMQARIGTSAAWVQSADFQHCDLCKRRMALVIQVPGTMLHPKKFQEGVFYLFGCKQHPEELKTVMQFY